jgi:branched-chain amino acid aminotransferase
LGRAILLNGRLVADDEARVSVFDRGFLFGDSIFEVVRTRRGHPFLLGPHLVRLRHSAAEIYLDLPFRDAELIEAVDRGLQAAGNEESYVRIMVTRGAGPLDLHPSECDEPTLLIIVMPLPAPAARMYEEGVRLAVVGRQRTDPRALNPAAKTGNYLNNVLAIIEARRRGVDDAVMLNAEGFITEGTTANVFFVEGGTVHTPALASGILEGITRGLVIRMLGEEAIPIAEGSYTADRLRGADEAFFTSTTRDVMPIREVDGHVLGGGRPGPFTLRLAARFAAL